MTFTAPTDGPVYLEGPPALVAFNGSTEYLQAPNVAKMTPTTQFYWAGWMRDTTAQNRNFWSQWDNGDELWQFGRSGASQYTFILAESAVTFGALSFTHLPDSNPYFVEAEYNGLLSAPDRFKYWVGRVEQTSISGSGTIPAALQSANPLAYMAAYQGVARKGMQFYNLYMDLTIPNDNDRDFLFGFEDPS